MHYIIAIIVVGKAVVGFLLACNGKGEVLRLLCDYVLLDLTGGHFLGVPGICNKYSVVLFENLFFFTIRPCTDEVPSPGLLWPDATKSDVIRRNPTKSN